MQTKNGKLFVGFSGLSFMSLSVFTVAFFGDGCNNQKPESPKKAEVQTANGGENRRNELQNQANDSDKHADDDKDKKDSDKKSKDKSSAKKTTTKDDDKGSANINSIISKLGLTKDEADTFKKFACNSDAEDLAKLANIVGGSRNFRLNNIPFGRDFRGLTQDDIDTLKALAGNSRSLSSDKIQNAQDLLCKNTSSPSKKSSSSDDDDDDDN